MSEEVSPFYTETPHERERLLALYGPEAREVIERYMARHPGMTALEAINRTVALAGTMWKRRRRRK
jgi:hypothetical protein